MKHNTIVLIFYHRTDCADAMTALESIKIEYLVKDTGKAYIVTYTCETAKLQASFAWIPLNRLGFKITNIKNL